MRNYLGIFVCVLISGLIGCASAGSASVGAEISAVGALGGVAPPAAFYEGDGGAGIRLAVLAPSPEGAVPDYLPAYVQGLLNYNFKKYSDVTLIDRQNLEKIIAEQDNALTGRFSDEEYSRIGSLTNAQYFLMGTLEKVSGAAYSLSLSITDLDTGEYKAYAKETGSLQEIEGTGTLINRATAELLSQMEVFLTEEGRKALAAGDMAVVKAETGVAKGIAAQSKGESVAALFNYTQSIAFDPSQIEALTRLNKLSLSIGGGTISEAIMNDIQARKRWLEVFKETARFFKDHPPFEITFDPNLVQEGLTDYARDTANLAMRVSLDPSTAGFTALNSLLEGLERTGKRRDWGFNGWPLLEVQPKTPGTVVFEGSRSFDFKIDVALLNERGKTIGRSSVTLNTGNINFTAGNKNVGAPPGTAGMVRFPNLKANDLSPTLTIRITGVNGIPARTLTGRGYMKIAPGSLGDRAPRPRTIAPDEDAPRQTAPRAAVQPERDAETSVPTGPYWISKTLRPHDVQWFTYTGPAGTCVFETDGDLDTYMELYDGDVLLARDDDSGTNRNARITYTVQSGKRYSIKIQEVDGASGSYRFRVR